MGSLSNNRINIPVIDISPSNPNAASELLSAARTFGFIFIANNSASPVIPPAIIAQVFSLSKSFFGLPTAVKQTCSISSNKAGKNHGWLSQGVEKLDPATQKRPDVKEAFNLGSPLKDGSYEQPIPPVLKENIALVRQFQAECAGLCARVLELVAVALGIERDWFTSRHAPSNPSSSSSSTEDSSVFRLLYYPQRTSSNDEVDIRAGAHSDYGSITTLFQLPGQPGLEILTPEEKWAPVPVDPLGLGELPILVNIGDLLEDWTGGLLKSTKHRVVFPAGEHGDRYSIAYFCHPLDDALLEAVPSEIVRHHERQNGRGRTADRVITASEHLMERLAATYTVK